jgi:hypothetical protein
MPMRNGHGRPHAPFYGTRLVLAYIAVVVTIALLLTILQPGGPL